MEIKAELKQPYTEDERIEFIIKQNHNLGYEIREIEGTWQEEMQVPCMKTVTEIFQEPVLDDDGKPFLDDDGNPIYKSVEVTREVQETETIVEIVKQPKYDEDGNPVLDENGEQVLEDVEVEKEIPKYRTEYVTHAGYNLQAWGYTEEERAQQEQERIAMLNMTGADVERAIYKVKGIDFDDILAMVKDNPAIDEKALKIEFKANNFFRGNPYIEQVGALLGFTSKMLDKFFETKDYHYLTTCTLTVNPTPESSLVVINSEIQKEITVPYGNVVDLVVSNDGYISHADILTLTEDRTLNIELEKIQTD